MTQGEQRIAIYKALGWTEVKEGPHHYGWRRGEEFRYCHEMPRYLEDLNIMHKVKEWLTEEQKELFEAMLVEVTIGPSNRQYWWDLRRGEVLKVASATAEQWAEAFLKTLGLWR